MLPIQPTRYVEPKCKQQRPSDQIVGMHMLVGIFAANQSQIVP